MRNLKDSLEDKILHHEREIAKLKATQDTELAYLKKKQSDIFALQENMKKERKKLESILSDAGEDLNGILDRMDEMIAEFLPKPSSKYGKRKHRRRSRCAIFREWLRKYKKDSLKPSDIPPDVMPPKSYVSILMKKEGWVRTGAGPSSQYVRRRRK